MFKKINLFLSAMIYPGEYVVWDLEELNLEYNFLGSPIKPVPNPYYLDIKEIKKWNDFFLSFFVETNTDHIFCIEYYSSPGFEIVVLIIKVKEDQYGGLKKNLKESKKELRESLFFDNERQVIISIVSPEPVFSGPSGEEKIDLMKKILIEKLPFLESF